MQQVYVAQFTLWKTACPVKNEVQMLVFHQLPELLHVKFIFCDVSFDTDQCVCSDYGRTLTSNQHYIENELGYLMGHSMVNLRYIQDNLLQ